MKTNFFTPPKGWVNLGWGDFASLPRSIFIKTVSATSSPLWPVACCLLISITKKPPIVRKSSISKFEFGQVVRGFFFGSTRFSRSSSSRARLASDQTLIRVFIMSQSVLRDILTNFATDERPVQTIIKEFKESRKRGKAQVYGFVEVNADFEPIYDQWWYIGRLSA